MASTPRYPHLLHGGDYNPDQWLDRPDILDKDVELMKQAGVSCVSLGIFAWTRMEPEDGVYDLGWLDQVIGRLWKGGIHIALATPTGAKPAWMAQKYPEVLRVDSQLRRMHFGERENHCLTSPVYRRKAREIDTVLAERYGNHPAVIMWHLSNEFCGDCRCPLCQEAFRGWLKERYGSLEGLNKAWYTGFWSQIYTDWSQVEAPSDIGERSCTAMQVDWRRFMTAQCRSFIEEERDAVKPYAPDLPCTVNMMEAFEDYDYFSLGRAVDVISWDSYPSWHSGHDMRTAASTAMNHDMMRSLKDKPFLLMESTPSQVNWKPHNKLKRPGVHMLSAVQALAHGSDSVMYFQWRKSRGGSEMFHGAVVDHYGESDTRVFEEVSRVGEMLQRADALCGARVPAKACILFDWENWWALDFVQAGHTGDMRYFETVGAFHRGLWKKSIAVDFRDMSGDTDLSGYSLVVAPMLFMTRNGIEEKLRRYVEGGGNLLVTWFSCVVDEHYQAHLGPCPHGLTDVLGLREAELDALYPGESNFTVLPDGTRCHLDRLCAIPDKVTAQVKAVYGTDFYSGQPCLTKNNYGRGHAWYLAAQPEQAGIDALMALLAKESGLTSALPDLPAGVVASRRGDAVLLQNFSDAHQTVRVPGRWTDAVTGKPVRDILPMQRFGAAVLLPEKE